jgi:UDP-2,3-diacylglucosamine hydrolase
VLHFLSDLHLSPETPGIARLFFAYLALDARAAERIFILGDLFEAWPGDDAIDDPESDFARGVVDALRRLRDRGTGVSLLRGNRDFLLGERFAERSGASLLPDPQILSLPDGALLLTHGDALCTGDAGYQAYREKVRAPAWRAAFLARPLAERKAIAAAMRRQSEAAKRGKALPAMDIDDDATNGFLRRHGCSMLIHGHTHRPGRYEHLAEGFRAERWVLADWHEERGEYLAWDGRRFSRHALA